jgi:transglutaminase-like putative cysteine protease
MMPEPWRLSFEHVTVFEYGFAVHSSFNEVRMTPLTTVRQTTLTADVATSPAATQYRYWDYWGTQVVAFDVAEPHDKLAIRARGVVDTATCRPPGACSWQELAGAAGAMCEFLMVTPFTDAEGPIGSAVEFLRTPDPVETVEAVCEWVHSALEYRPGVTGVHTSAAEVIQTGQGVCQDFAHLAVALLRSIGVPARYVSGYLHPVPEPEVGVTVEGQSHAWIEAWTCGWWELDPTNLVAVGPRHVAVGRGRDYGDVPPLKGIYAGGSQDSMTTTVSIQRTH